MAAETPSSSEADIILELYNESAAEVGPGFDHLRRQLLFKLRRNDQKRVIEVNAAPRMRPEIAHRIFTHKTGDHPDEFWAKGLVLANLGRNRFESLFWQTGIGREEMNVHHRDALAFVNLARLNDHKRGLANVNAMGLVPKEHWPNEALFADHQKVVEELQAIMSEAEEHSELVATERNQSSFGEHDLGFAVGFQLTATEGADGCKITKLELHSTLAKACLSRDLRIYSKGLAHLIVYAVHAIDPERRAFTKIGLLIPVGEIEPVTSFARPLWRHIGVPDPIRLTALKR